MCKLAKYVRNCVVFWKKLHNWHLFSSWSSICNCLANTHMHPWDQLSNSPADRTITQFFSQNLTEIMWGCTSGFLQRLGMVVWPGAVNISERRSKSRIRSDDRSQPRIATGQLPSAISFLSQSTLSSQSHPVSPLVLLCLSQREPPTVCHRAARLLYFLSQLPFHPSTCLPDFGHHHYIIIHTRH